VGTFLRHSVVSNFYLMNLFWSI